MSNLGSPETGPLGQTTSSGWNPPGTTEGRPTGAPLPHPTGPPGVRPPTPGAPPPAPPTGGGVAQPLPNGTPGGFVDTGTGIPSAYDSVYQQLQDLNLPQLTDWFMKQIKGGVTPDELALNLRQTPEFKTEYWVIGARAAKGLPPVSVTDILNYRNNANQFARQIGLPPGFMDKQAVDQLQVDDVSSAELSSRIVNDMGAVMSADPNVKAYFNQTFGTDGGPGALAAFFMDDQKAEPLLAQHVREAEIGGSSRDFGFNIDPAAVAGYAAQGITQAQADSGFSQMSKIASLFDTLPSEIGGIGLAGDGASVPVGGGGAQVNATTGADALVGKDASALDAITQKLDSRQAAATGKVGIEEDQTHGFRGLGSAL